jgi:hypothetical protein
MVMKAFKPTRWNGFLLFFALAVVWYLYDCLLHFREHPDLPWYETGIYTGPWGFPRVVLLAVLALGFLLFRKGK